MARYDIRAILADPVKRKRLLIGVIVATQAREGIVTIPEQAEIAYEKALTTKKGA